MSDLILHNGRFTTLNPKTRDATAIAISEGKISAVGSDNEVMAHKGSKTKVIDLKRHRVIPGLNDSHTHLIRGGLSYNMELRWENVPSVSDALAMLRKQAANTPAPQWVRVVGGWSEFQFAERRMPTLEEINAAAPDTPVFILHLYLNVADLISRSQGNASKVRIAAARMQIREGLERADSGPSQLCIQTAAKRTKPTFLSAP